MTRSPLDEPLDEVLGRQTPRIRCVPPHANTESGREAIELAADVGLILDPWQELVLELACAERADGKWAAFEVGVVLPRQNGKNSILEARELAGLFLFGEKLIVHSAHLMDTALKHMQRMKQLIESNPDYDRQVAQIIEGNGKEKIKLKSGAEIVFKTRTKGGGRGLTGDLVILDEAYELPNATIAALVPTMAARSKTGNPQMWYTSSAVNQQSHHHGFQLAKVRRRGIAGTSKRLAYFEWSVPDELYNPKQPDVVAKDPAMWAMANPALGIRISLEYIEDEQDLMPAREFAVERLGIGDWPIEESGDEGTIGKAAWAALVDEAVKAGGEPTPVGIDVAFAAEVSYDRKWASIAMYGVREDGLGQIELTDRRRGTDWIVPRLLELRDKWNPVAFGVDGKGPSLTLVQDLKDAGITLPEDPDKPKRGELVVLTLPEMAAAVGQMLDAIDQRAFRHLDDADLNDAALDVVLRPVGDLQVLGRKHGEISAFTAATVARAAYRLRVDLVNAEEVEPWVAYA